MKYRAITGNIACDQMLNCIDFYAGGDKKLSKMIFRSDYFLAISEYVKKHMPDKEVGNRFLFNEIEILMGDDDMFEPLIYEFHGESCLKGI